MYCAVFTILLFSLNSKSRVQQQKYYSNIIVKTLTIFSTRSYITLKNWKIQLCLYSTLNLNITIIIIRDVERKQI